MNQDQVLGLLAIGGLGAAFFIISRNGAIPFLEPPKESVPATPTAPLPQLSEPGQTVIVTPPPQTETTYNITMPPPEMPIVPQSFNEPLPIPAIIGRFTTPKVKKPIIKPLELPPKITAPESEKKAWVKEAASRGPVSPALLWLMDPAKGFG